MARNTFHDAFVEALKFEGWTITDDPLLLTIGDRKLMVDLGAERDPIAASKGNDKIAVEITSFLGDSPVTDLDLR